MLDTMTRYLTGIGDRLTQRAVRAVVEPLVQRYSNCAVTTAGLVISSTTTVAKIGAADFVAFVRGTLVTIAAGTDMPALTGLDIGAGKYNVIYFLVDVAGTTSAIMGVEGATVAKIKYPEIPNDKALIGFIVVYYASAFTGGSTALNTATTLYFSPTGPVDPTVLA